MCLWPAPRLLDISPASSLSFVLDTTGSMGEEINAAKIQARRIVEQRRGSPMEPAHYVLVPFHDPGNCGLSGIVEKSKVQGKGLMVAQWASQKFLWPQVSLSCAQ